MGKNTDKNYPITYTTTDSVKYTGAIPDCIPSGENSCDTENRGLTGILENLLNLYCDTLENHPLEMDISEVDIECLIDSNPDIEIEPSLELKDLLEYYKDHICHIYDELCEECPEEQEEPDSTCNIVVNGLPVVMEICDILQEHQDDLEDHEIRITNLEEASGSYEIDPLVIPVNKNLNVQDSSMILFSIEHYLKFLTPELYLSDQENGDKLENLDIGDPLIGTFGELRVDSDSLEVKYTYSITDPVEVGTDTFELYLTDGEGSNYLVPISIYTISSCCDPTDPEEPAEPVTVEYLITFDLEEGYETGFTIDTSESVPSGEFYTVTMEDEFTVKIVHNKDLDMYLSTGQLVDAYGPVNLISKTNNELVYEIEHSPVTTIGVPVSLKVTINYIG